MAVAFSHEAVFETAANQNDLPGVALVATDVTGKFAYKRAFGKTAQGEPVKTDTPMWIASCTKLMVTVAALQQVSRGKIGLDDDLAGILPELASMKEVLEGWNEDNGEPIISKRDDDPITLRQLLTHSSGQGHPLFDPELQRYTAWKKSQGHTTNLPDATKQTLPEYFTSSILLGRPAKIWHYGGGVDWAGKLVERLSGGQPLEDYLRQNVWDPLGMTATSFLSSRPEIAENKVSVSRRDPKTGKLEPAGEGAYLLQYGSEVEEMYGGSSCWTTAESFLLLLRSLCANDGKVLDEKLGEEMFRPQLTAESKEVLNRQTKTSHLGKVVFGVGWRNTEQEQFQEQEFDWGLGGIMGLRDQGSGRRKPRTLSWSGGVNLYWWMDRESGLCGAYFSQMVPIGDAKTLEMLDVFERSVYDEYRKVQYGVQ